jgi:hypothetical protein
MTHFLPIAERQKRTTGFRDGRARCTGAGASSGFDCVAVMFCSRLLDPPLGCAAET